MKRRVNSGGGLAFLVLALALGWAAREVVHAQERAKVVESKTVTLDQVAMETYKDGESVVGTAGAYFTGDTAGTKNFITGRFVLESGKTPHAPHKHVEEEVMIVESGTGEIYCDGKTTPVGPGSAMYTAPMAPHGIVNTGKTPLVFYFIKWDARGRD
jgi:mannose-6-phosphate isomerase-like protein (cupin superfamily)